MQDENEVSMSYAVTQMAGQTFSYPPSPQDWSNVQRAVRDLYVKDKLPLKEVRSVLRDTYGFRATDRMIKARLKSWGYLKNAKKEDWHFLVLLYMQCKEQGQHTTDFDVRGHRKTLRDLLRFIRNQSMTLDQFYNEAKQRHGDRAIPNYIVAVDPTDSKSARTNRSSPDTITSSPPKKPNQDQLTSYQPPHARELLGYSLQPRQVSSFKRSDSLSSGSDRDFDMSSSKDVFPNQSFTLTMRDSAYETSSTTSASCQALLWDMNAYSQQIVNPTSLTSKIGDPDITSWSLMSGPDSDNASESDIICTRCGMSSRSHFVSLDSLEPQSQLSRNIVHGPSGQQLHLPVTTKEEGSHVWIARCFLAAVLAGRGQHEGSAEALTSAATEWERLLLDKDALLLTAANQMVTMLCLHAQGMLAKQIILTAKEIADKHYSEESPINTTLEFLAEQASGTLSESRITSEHLRNVYVNFLTVLNPKHPYVIAARFNLGWMLRYEGYVGEAEQHVNAVYRLSVEVLGDPHLQTITALSVLAGCAALGNEERRKECIERFRGVVEGSSNTLGPSHPYTIEAKRRLAWHLFNDAGENYTSETLELYKEVLLSQVKFMGRNHTFTQRARKDYEDALKEMNLWTDIDGEPSQQQQELIVLLSPPPKTWIRVDRPRSVSTTSGGSQTFLNHGISPDAEFLTKEECDHDILDADECNVSDVASASSGDDFKGY